MADYVFRLFGQAPAGFAWATNEGVLLVDGEGLPYLVSSPASTGLSLEVRGGRLTYTLRNADGVATDEECPAPGDLVEAEINKVATQYREAGKFLAYMRVVLGEVEGAIRATCAIPDFFDLDTAVGDQLTLLGKRMGWPRCHCVCDVAPVFGFDCGPNPLGIPIVGFCEGGTWADCDEVGNGEICLSDDEVYRGFLRARRYQMLGLYDIASLQAALRHVWGPAANVANTGAGKVVIAPGRPLTAVETSQLPLVVRVMPIAPGIKAKLFLGGDDPIFGFGEGWGGFCADAQWLCETDPNAYACA
jgi:hypothetical protein